MLKFLKACYLKESDRNSGEQIVIFIKKNVENLDPGLLIKYISFINHALPQQVHSLLPEIIERSQYPGIISFAENLIKLAKSKGGL